MRVLFVCTGNLCRSPLAEVALKRILQAAGKNDVQVSSTGVWASQGLPPPDDAIRVAQEMGLDLSTHLSRPISEDLVRSADWIIVMAPEHEEDLRDSYPNLACRVEGLPAYLAEGKVLAIPDPLGYSLKVYRSCYDQIERAVRAFFEQELDAAPGKGRRA